MANNSTETSTEHSDAYRAFLDALANVNTPNEVLKSKGEKAVREIQGFMESGQPTNEKEALLFLALQVPSTTIKDLDRLIERHYDCVDVARLAARHISTSIDRVAKFLHIFPEDTAFNPNLESYRQDPAWEKLANHKPYFAVRYHYGSRNLRLNTNPDAKIHWYMAKYWLPRLGVLEKRYLLGQEGLDEALVEPYTRDKSAHVRKQIAQRLSLSERLAQIISEDRAKTVRQALAENTRCPASVLANLTQDKDETVRKAAQENPACPENAIHAAKLAEAARPKAPQTPVKNMNADALIKKLGDSSTAPNTLIEMAQHEKAFVRAGVALHNNCPEEILQNLSKDPSIVVRQSVAFNARTPPDTLEQLLSSGQKELHLALASNTSLTEAQQLRLVEDADEFSLRELADTTEFEAVWRALAATTSKESPPADEPNWRATLTTVLDSKGKGLFQLQRGRKTRQLFVSKLIARHPKCPEGLKGHYAYYLMSSLAKNPGYALLLLEDANAIRPRPYADWLLDQWLTEGVAPGHVSNFYLRGDDLKRRRKAVTNQTANIANLQPHVFDEDTLVKKRLAKRTDITQFMYEILGRDKKEVVRELVAKNKACPIEVLNFLADDKSAAVAAAAKQNPKFKAQGETEKPVSAKKQQFKNKGQKKTRIRMAKEAVSLSILRDLAEDKQSAVRLQVANNSIAPSDSLSMLANDTDHNVRSAVAQHDNTGDETLESLFGDPAPSVRLKALKLLSRRRSTPDRDLQEPGQPDWYERAFDTRVYDEATLEPFYQDEDESIQMTVAGRTGNAEIQHHYAAHGSDKVLRSLARNRRLDSRIAEKLIETGELEILQGLIECTANEDILFRSINADPSLTPKAGKNLATMKLMTVQEYLASHKNAEARMNCGLFATDPEIIMRCAQDPHQDVRSYTAQNWRLSSQHIEALINKPTWDIVHSLYRSHPKLTAPFTQQLIERGDERVRATVAAEADLPLDLELMLAKDKSSTVRSELASNERGIGKEARALLKTDPDYYVQANLRDCPHRER
ncbi:MAG: hypothetical protein ACPHVS_06145 [Alcanivorax sp.]|uniref:hypothetical protein n=1 Tax=Alcanivorax sp. TaxID=1872427 RepID=UPI00243FDC25